MCPLGAQSGHPHGAWQDDYSPGLGETHGTRTLTMAHSATLHGTGCHHITVPHTHPCKGGAWSSQAPGSRSPRTGCPGPQGCWMGAPCTSGPLSSTHMHHELAPRKAPIPLVQPHQGAPNTPVGPAPWDYDSSSQDQGCGAAAGAQKRPLTERRGWDLGEAGQDRPWDQCREAQTCSRAWTLP